MQLLVEIRRRLPSEDWERAASVRCSIKTMAACAGYSSIAVTFSHKASSSLYQSRLLTACLGK
jgi:hypothetical protein